MACKSVLNRNERRRKLVEIYRDRRAKLRAILKDQSVSPEAKETAQRQMQKLPRDSCAARLRNRCAITGRARGYFRRFGLSRHMARHLSMNGEVPGVTKSSW